ncbi:CDP-alcohol phosphatidyltransferase family protein [Kineococcus indalonis]|uniref:CDP-alcohol phosphatidyltransferase family protein n=1 Tax=Kineococcus indalonis TaxID=2696566 RepID=UPI001412046F|nr:CDP-alcohol phosphatidyltransferase family protein [Kineococcus indalonis]NAZ85168.1 CDP-alcohol phosphatidyltransferase family protein [Kineococcus indalonis]
MVTAGGQAVSERVWTLPNALSSLRLLLVPVFAVLIAGGHDGWALLVLSASGASDYLDGHLARRWDQVTRLGQLLDPFADRLYILTTLLGLAWRELVPWWLVVVLVGRDVLLACTVPVLASVGHGPPPVHFLGKAGTFCLLHAFPLLLLGEVSPALSDVAGALGWAFALWGTGLYWWAGVLYVQQVAAVVRAERSGGRA